MAPKRSPAELGGVVDENGAYRARIHIHENRITRNIRGPRRDNETRAFEDLSNILHGWARCKLCSKLDVLRVNNFRFSKGSQN